MLRMIALACLVLGTTPALAQDADQPLWGTLHAGMSKAEVKAAQPDKVVHINESCVALPEYDYEQDKLISVTLVSGVLEPESCRHLALTSLVQKYGSKFEKGSHISTEGGVTKVTDIAWTLRDKRITFEFYDNENRWRTQYRAAYPDATPDMLNKF